VEGQEDNEDHHYLKRISKIFPQTSKEGILIIHLIADACFHKVMVKPWKPPENNKKKTTATLSSEQPLSNFVPSDKLQHCWLHHN
jgi:hypothetical protein